MFERYNKKARRALFYARWEASRLASPTIEPEHLVLGLLREGEKSVNKLWRAFSIDPAVLRREIEGERLPLENASPTTELPLAEESKRILVYAFSEMEALGHAWVGGEHLLIGILREADCRAARVLNDYGLWVDQVRGEIMMAAILS